MESAGGETQIGPIVSFLFIFPSFFSLILALFEVSEPVIPQLRVGGGVAQRPGELSHVIWVDLVYIAPNSHAYVPKKTLDWADDSESKGSLSLLT